MITAELQIWYYTINTILLISGTVGGVLATIWGVTVGWKKVTGQSEQKLDKVRQDLINNLEANCAAWKEKYETEHADFLKYRDDTHKLNNETQAKILTLNSENAALKFRTDVSPLIEMQQKMLETLEKVTQILLQVEEKLSKMHP